MATRHAKRARLYVGHLSHVLHTGRRRNYSSTKLTEDTEVSGVPNGWGEFTSRRPLANWMSMFEIEVDLSNPNRTAAGLEPAPTYHRAYKHSVQTEHGQLARSVAGWSTNQPRLPLHVSKNQSLFVLFVPALASGPYGRRRSIEFSLLMSKSAYVCVCMYAAVISRYNVLCYSSVERSARPDSRGRRAKTNLRAQARFRRN